MVDRIVIASPISKSPAIVGEFLSSLDRLDPGGCAIDWLFVDDNSSAAASSLLHAFMESRSGAILLPPPREAAHVSEDALDRWNIELVDRVANHKDRILANPLVQKADGVLLVDSDLVLHPLTLRILLAANVDIVSEVFWTEFEGVDRELPNVWMTDYYTLFATRGTAPPDRVVAAATKAFLDRLWRPGLHSVGGLGACTLIRRKAIEAGVRFTHLPNLSWVGEDRHFCIRAAALGFSLWADTHVPPLHLYRSSDFSKVEAHRATEQSLTERWRIAVEARRAAEAAVARGGSAMLTDEMRKDLAERMPPDGEVAVRALGNVITAMTAVPEGTRVELEVELAAAEARPPWQCRGLAEVVIPTPRLVLDRSAQASTPDVVAPELLVRTRVPILLSMVVRNEADRYLREVLGLLAQVVDDAVIIDDASTDGTPELSRELLAAVPHRVEVLPRSLFEREHELRAMQWSLALERRPGWILNLDADELLEERAIELLPRLLQSATASLVGFRLFDMWDATNYRSDELWTAHLRYWPVLARPQPDQRAIWRQSAQHCGRWPLTVSRQPMEIGSLRVKHLGWMRPEDRAAKYERYRRLDPDGAYGSKKQYDSILDPAPTLLPWEPD